MIEKNKVSPKCFVGDLLNLQLHNEVCRSLLFSCRMFSIVCFFVVKWTSQKTCPSLTVYIMLFICNDVAKFVFHFPYFSHVSKRCRCWSSDHPAFLAGSRSYLSRKRAKMRSETQVSAFVAGKALNFKWRVVAGKITYKWVGINTYENTILMGWTSINTSYFDVNYRGTRFWHTAKSFLMILNEYKW